MKTLVTNELFSDFIECGYLRYLKITGATGPKSDVVDVSGRHREGYHRQASTSCEPKVILVGNSLPAICFDLALWAVLNQNGVWCDALAEQCTEPSDERLHFVN